MNFKRRVRIAAWNDTGDPTCFACVPIDLTRADAFLKAHNEKNPELRLTYTHIATKAVAEALYINKKINGTVSFGNYIHNESVALTVLVDVEGKNLVGAMANDCNKLGFIGIAEQLKKQVKKLKLKKDKDVNEQVKLFSLLPTFFIGMVVTVASFFTYNLGFSLPALKMNKEHFGQGIITNTSRSGIFNVRAPLVNFMRTITVAVINNPRMLPQVDENGEIVIRKVMNFNVSFDHRFGDGSDAMKMIKKVEDIWQNPEKYLN